MERREPSAALLREAEKIDTGELAMAGQKRRVEQRLIPKRDVVRPELIPGPLAKPPSRPTSSDGRETAPYAGLASTRTNPFSVIGQVAHPPEALSANQSWAVS